MTDDDDAVERWLSEDHHAEAVERDLVPPEPASEAERRLHARARILDWAQVAALVLPAVGVLAALVLVVAVNGRANKAIKEGDAAAAAAKANAESTRKLAEANAALSRSVMDLAERQDRLDAIAAALGKLESATTEADRRSALVELAEASEARDRARQGDAAPPAATTTTTTAGPRARATPTSTTTAPPRGPPPSTTTTTDRCARLPLSCGLPPPTLPG